MIRHGAVVVFKAGVSEADANAALAKIAHLLQPELSFPGGYKNPPVETVPKVKEFDDAEGGPTWYIP